MSSAAPSPYLDGLFLVTVRSNGVDVGFPTSRLNFLGGNAITYNSVTKAIDITQNVTSLTAPNGGTITLSVSGANSLTWDGTWLSVAGQQFLEWDGTHFQVQHIHPASGTDPSIGIFSLASVSTTPSWPGASGYIVVSAANGINLMAGAVNMLRVAGTNLGIYSATPVPQANRAGQLTDSTTGTPSSALNDVGMSFSQATLNNNFATLLAKYNKIEAMLSAAGGGIGVSA
jgi:hypothetical protein